LTESPPKLSPASPGPTRLLLLLLLLLLFQLGHLLLALLLESCLLMTQQTTASTLSIPTAFHLFFMFTNQYIK
jgi:hypothetical protein